MQQQTARGRAPLPRIREAGRDRGVDRLADVGIVHHDQRVLAAQLELRPRQVRGRLRLDLLPHLRRP